MNFVPVFDIVGTGYRILIKQRLTTIFLTLGLILLWIPQQLTAAGREAGFEEYPEPMSPSEKERRRKISKQHIISSDKDVIIEFSEINMIECWASAIEIDIHLTTIDNVSLNLNCKFSMYIEPALFASSNKSFKMIGYGGNIGPRIFFQNTGIKQTGMDGLFFGGSFMFIKVYEYDRNLYGFHLELGYRFILFDYVTLNIAIGAAVLWPSDGPITDHAVLPFIISPDYRFAIGIAF